MSICVISFSARKNGNCSDIGKLVCSLLSDVKLYDFSDFTIHPCGECEYECFINGDQCPWITDKEYEIMDAVTKSELTYFVIPNYCDYPCANFFTFNERSQCYFQKRADLQKKYEQVPKRFIVVSNTNEENFKGALSYHTKGEPDILFLPARKYGKVSISGDLLTSEQAVADITEFTLKKKK